MMSVINIPSPECQDVSMEPWELGQPTCTNGSNHIQPLGKLLCYAHSRKNDRKYVCVCEKERERMVAEQEIPGIISKRKCVRRLPITWQKRTKITHPVHQSLAQFCSKTQTAPRNFSKQKTSIAMCNKRLCR